MYIFTAAIINVVVDLFMISPILSFFKTYALPRIATRVLRDYLPAEVSNNSPTTPAAAPSRRRVTSVVAPEEEVPAVAPSDQHLHEVSLPNSSG